MVPCMVHGTWYKYAVQCRVVSGAVQGTGYKVQCMIRVPGTWYAVHGTVHSTWYLLQSMVTSTSVGSYRFVSALKHQAKVSLPIVLGGPRFSVPGACYESTSACYRVHDTQYYRQIAGT